MNQATNINIARLDRHHKMFDHRNPLSPAGIWAAQRNANNQAWDLQLRSYFELISR